MAKAAAEVDDGRCTAEVVLPGGRAILLDLDLPVREPDGVSGDSLEKEIGAYLEKEESKNGAQRCIRQLLVLLCQVRRQGPDGFSSVVVQLGGESRPVKSRRTQRMRLKKAMAYGR